MSISDSFIAEALEKLESNRSEYDKVGQELCLALENSLSDFGSNVVSVTARTKGKDSLKEKIYRKNYFIKYQTGSELITNLSDGIGVRVTCLLSENEKELYEALKKVFSCERIVSDRKYYFEGTNRFGISYSKQPEQQVNGQPIYRVDGIIDSGLGVIPYELQIKSLVHCLWGEVEHSLFYKKYDYIISNSYYAQLMQSMDKELENIDGQIGALKSHLEQSDEDQSKNVREIAAYLLSKSCKDILEKAIDCNIDLREVYDVLVDLDFLFIEDTNQEIEKLNGLINKSHNCYRIGEYYGEIENASWEKDRISPYNMDIAVLINNKIKAGDIYWKAFAVIYKALNNDTVTYSEMLNIMAGRLIGLIEVCGEEIDKIASEQIADQLYFLVKKALIDVASEVGKIGFYSIKNNINRLREEYTAIVDELQYKVAKNLNEEVFGANIDTILLYLKANLFYLVKQKPGVEFIDVLSKSFKESNDYSLSVSRELLEWFGFSSEVVSDISDSFEEV